MDFLELLKFAPMAIGLAWIVYLVFKQDFFKQGSLGKLFTYFVGIVIMFFAVGWLVDSFVFSWANDRLQNAESSVEFQQLKQRSERILDDAFNEEGDTVQAGPVAQPTAVQVVPIVVTATPAPGTPLDPGNSSGPTSRGPTQYTVQQGDTLTKIAQKFGTTVNDIMRVNGLTSANYIRAGQVLNIPAPSQ